MTDNVVDNVMLLFQFVKRRSILGFRHVFCDLLSCISEISQYVKSGAHYASEQVGLPIQICMLSSFCQFIACHSFNCQNLMDLSSPVSNLMISRCEVHRVSNLFVVSIDTFKRIELFHASCTTIIGRMVADNIYLHDLIGTLSSLLSEQIIGFSSEVQEVIRDPTLNIAQCLLIILLYY